MHHFRHAFFQPVDIKHIMEGSTGVLFPGERSANTRKDRLAKGIPIDPTTWDQVEALFDRYGVRDQLVDVVPSGENP